MNLPVIAVAGAAAVALGMRARAEPRARLHTLGAGTPRSPAQLPVRARQAIPTRLPRLARRVLGDIAARRAGARRRERLRRELPVVVELFRMAVTAGLTPVQALHRVTPLAPAISATVLAAVRGSLDLGVGLEAALDRLRMTAPDLAGLADVLSASAVLGVGVDPALARLADEARASVRRAAEARARTVPVRLLFPLVVCVLPAFALLGVAPSLLAGLTG